MNFLMLFSLLYYVSAKSEDFINSMALGESGILIFWPPTNETVQFKVSHKALRGKFENITKGPILVNGGEDQCKIPGLEENTPYQITIDQYQMDFYHDKKPEKTYVIERKTDSKTNSTPTKPAMEYRLVSGKEVRIKWIPCGKNRDCRGQPAGTHFVFRYKLLNQKDTFEIRVPEDSKAEISYYIFLPGLLYTGWVVSINGNSESSSHPEEIFVPPRYPAVKNVKVISLPGSSLLVSWNPSDTESILGHIVMSTSDTDVKLERNFWAFHVFDEDKFRQDKLFQQTILTGLKPNIKYALNIIPKGLYSGYGLSYQMEFTYHEYQDDQPIALPDFNFYIDLFDKFANTCVVLFQWLPCGQTSDCGNSKPGSDYDFVIEPEPKLKKKLIKFGYYKAELRNNEQYKVTVTSKNGASHSKSVTETFKNCSALIEW